MINIDKCRNIAKSLAAQSKEKLGAQKLNDFFDSFDKFVAEYKNKYKFSSTSIELQKLESFFKWASEAIKDKDAFTPIIVDKMVNGEDLYSLSLYQNFYAGTDLIPNINAHNSEYYENGGGENALALITGCHWIEQGGVSVE
ncbi:hypothetical protein MIDIC_70046 [Alphaproteobacteria bacterium]